jgi:outer membrane beta-barrel protein
MKKTISYVLAALMLSTPALADRKRNKLESEPAVRHRLLLVKNRFEAALAFESTINADFKHFVGGGLKLEYHLSDMLSFGGIGIFSTAFDTNLVSKITDTLEPNVDDATREPSVQEFEQRLNTMPIHGAVYVSLTPWYGKLAAFSTAFVNFDFYFQAGVSFASLKSSCDPAICDDMAPGQPSGMDPDGNPLPPDDNPNNDPPLNDGSRFGLYLAGGIHVFLNDFLALELTFRDYAFSDNPSGADYFPDLFVCDTSRYECESDNRFLHHLFAGVGLSVMLPMKVKRTR